MAITVNNAQSTNAGFPGTSWNAISYTVSSGTDQILCVFVGTGNDPSITHDSVTFNSDALTKGPDIEQLNGGWYVRGSLWYRLAPDVATANITVSFSASPSDCTCCAVYLNGADQSAPEATASDTTTASPADVDITTVSDDAGIVCGAHSDITDSGMTPVSNFTEDTETSVASSYSAALGHRILATAGAATVGWTYSGGTNNAIVAAAFAEASAAVFQQHSFQVFRDVAMDL